MTEEEYRAEMAKQAKIANLIELRRLAGDNSDVGRFFDRQTLNIAIQQELMRR